MGSNFGGHARGAVGLAWCLVLVSTLSTSLVSTSTAHAQQTTIDGKPAFCFQQSGVCVVGGVWTPTTNGLSVGSTEAEPVELRLPGDLRFAISPDSSLAIRTDVRDPSLDATVGLGFATTNGAISGLAIRGPSVTLKIGRGSALSGRSFAVGSQTVRKNATWIYLYASFAGETTLRLPGTTVDLPVPTPAEGLSSQLLIGLDPAAPTNVVFYLGGGFTSLLTSQTVTDGSVLVSLGADVSLDLGSFRTTSTGNGSPTPVTVRPTIAAQGTISLFSGDEDASRSSSSTSTSGSGTNATQPGAASQPRKRKPIPISIGGGLAIDFDADRDGRLMESFADMRFGGNDVSLTIDDVGLGQSVEVGRGFFYYDPSATPCGEVGRVLARVGSVQSVPLAGTPLEFLDPGPAGYRFDAAACGASSMVRLSAGNVSAGAFPLANASISFGRGGVSVNGTIGFLGSNVALRGTVDGRSLRLRSSSAIEIGGRSITNASLELVLGPSPKLRFRGYVEIAGQRFAIDQTFSSLPTSLAMPEIEISQSIELPSVSVLGTGASSSVTLRGTLQARFSESSWRVQSSGRLSWEASASIAGARQSFGDSYSVNLDIGSRGIEAAVREWKWPGTNVVIIPGSERRFGSAYEPPTERPPVLVVSPARDVRFTLASNVRAPASSTGLAGPGAHVQDVIVTLGGTVERASGTLSSLGVLPAGSRPSATLQFGAIQTPRTVAESPVVVEVLPTGEVRLATPSTTITAVSLDGISFTRAPEAGETLPLAPGCSAAVGYEAPTVVGRGSFIRTQGTATCTGSVERIARLPSSLRRATRTQTFELMTSAGAIQVNLTEDGWLTWESGPRSFTWVSLSGLEFSTMPWARRELEPATNVEHGDGNMLGARIHRFGGLVWLQGRVERGSNGLTHVATLPIGMRPMSTRVFHVSRTFGQTARVEVRATGEVIVTGSSTERTVSLSGIRFYLDDASSELALVRQALVDFAKGIKNSEMKSSWGRGEDAWLAAVRGATTVAELRTQLQALVGHMSSDSTRRSFDDEKPAWLARVAAATTPAQLARELRELESQMKRGALTDTWDDVDAAWRAELDGYAAP